MTLFGWPRDGEHIAGRLCVLGAPRDDGNLIRRGAAAAPAAIRQASRAHAPPRVAGIDRGDVGGAPGDLAAFLAELAEATARVHADGMCPLVLGGDHALSFAAISTLQAAGDLCLIWLDAHTDFSPWFGGAAHNHKQVLRRLIKLPGIRRVIQIGYRGFTGDDERALCDKATVVTSAEARTIDADALLALIPDHLPCYLSIDIDVVDPIAAPGTAAPVPDGLSPARVGELVRTLVRHRRVIGADVVEVNPALDVDDETSAVAAGVLHAIADAWGHQLAPAPRSQETGHADPDL